LREEKRREEMRWEEMGSYETGLEKGVQFGAVDCFFPDGNRRSMDFRTGERLGKKDHIVY
jgi:hypothetical protein